MAGRNTVTLHFEGKTSGLLAAVSKAEAALDKLDKKSIRVGRSSKALFGAAGLGAAAAGIGAATGALGGLSLLVGTFTSGINDSKDAVEKYNQAMESGTAKAWEKYHNAVAGLTPVQKDFHTQLIEGQKHLGELRKTASGAMLPGLLKGLEGSISLLPIFDTALHRTGTILGDTSEQFGQLFKSRDFQKNLDEMLRSFDPVTKAMSGGLLLMTDKLVAFGAAMKPATAGFGTFITDVTTGFSGMLTNLEPHADSFKRIWESLGSIMRTLLPIVGSAAGTFADRLAPALESAARWLDENKGFVEWFITNLPMMIAGFKGLQILTKIAGWGSTALGFFRSFGGAVDDADGKTRKFGDRLGGLKALAGAGLLAGGVIAFKEIADESGRSADKMGDAEQTIYDLGAAAEQVLSGDLVGIFKEIGSEWDQMVMDFQTGTSQAGQWWGELNRAISGFKIEPITIPIDANPDQARAASDKLLADVNSSGATVTINGNQNPAGFALREVIRAIDAGEGTVDINGQDMPAQDALRYVIGVINNSAGTVDVNGNPIPAGQALSDFLNRTNASSGTVKVNANTSAAQGVLNGFINMNDGRTIRIFTSVLGSGGLMSAGRLASGGAVSGPGTGTSDTAGMYALSDGEHVLTAREVQMAGGQDAIYRLRQAIRSGKFHGFAGGGSVGMGASTGPSGGQPLGSRRTNGIEVSFVGNMDSAFASAFMKLVRTGQIQIKAA